MLWKSKEEKELEKAKRRAEYQEKLLNFVKSLGEPRTNRDIELADNRIAMYATMTHPTLPYGSTYVSKCLAMMESIELQRMYNEMYSDKIQVIEERREKWLS